MSTSAELSTSLVKLASHAAGLAHKPVPLGRSQSTPLICGPQWTPLATHAWKNPPKSDTGFLVMGQLDPERTPKLGLQDITEEEETEHQSEPVPSAAATISHESQRQFTPGTPSPTRGAGAQIETQDTADEVDDDMSDATTEAGYDTACEECTNDTEHSEDEDEQEIPTITLPAGFVPSRPYQTGFSGWLYEGNVPSEFFLEYSRHDGRMRFRSPREAVRLNLLTPWIHPEEPYTCLQRLTAQGIVDPTYNAEDIAALTSIHVTLQLDQINMLLAPPQPTAYLQAPRTPVREPQDLPSSSPAYSLYSPDLNLNLGMSSPSAVWYGASSSSFNNLPGGYFSGSSASSPGSQVDVSAQTWSPPAALPSSPLPSSPRRQSRPTSPLASHRYNPYSSARSAAAPPDSGYRSISELLPLASGHVLAPASIVIPQTGSCVFSDASGKQFIGVLTDIRPVTGEIVTSTLGSSFVPAAVYGPNPASGYFAQGSSSMSQSSSFAPVADYTTDSASSYHASASYQAASGDAISAQPQGGSATVPTYATADTQGLNLYQDFDWLSVPDLEGGQVFASEPMRMPGGFVFDFTGMENTSMQPTSTHYAGRYH